MPLLPPGRQIASHSDNPTPPTKNAPSLFKSLPWAEPNSIVGSIAGFTNLLLGGLGLAGAWKGSYAYRRSQICTLHLVGGLGHGKEAMHICWRRGGEGRGGEVRRWGGRGGELEILPEACFFEEIIPHPPLHNSSATRNSTDWIFVLPWDFFWNLLVPAKRPVRNSPCRPFFPIICSGAPFFRTLLFSKHPPGYPFQTVKQNGTPSGSGCGSVGGFGGCGGCGGCGGFGQNVDGKRFVGKGEGKKGEGEKLGLGLL